MHARRLCSKNSSLTKRTLKDTWMRRLELNREKCATSELSSRTNQAWPRRCQIEFRHYFWRIRKAIASQKNKTSSIQSNADQARQPPQGRDDHGHDEEVWKLDSRCARYGATQILGDRGDNFLGMKHYFFFFNLFDSDIFAFTLTFSLFFSTSDVDCHCRWNFRVEYHLCFM